MIELALNGPAKNALGTEMMQSIVDRLAAAGGQPVLVTGTGDAFSAGLNLKEVAALDTATGDRFMRLLERCMCALYLYPGPTVAFVNGHAIAGGCVLAQCCDVRVAADDPKLRVGLNEVALGVRFPPRIMAIVKNRIPARFREEVILGAGLFDAARSKELGLVDEVGTIQRARARLDALAAHPAQAYALAKRDLRGARDSDVASDAALDSWMTESLPIWTSGAVKQKIAAVLRR